MVSFWPILHPLTMPPDDDSLQRIEALERKVARLEQEVRRSSVQRALMDERILVLERNRLFRLWNKVYRAAANLYGRFGSGKRYGGLTDLRTPGDYEQWVNREQHQMESEDHRGDIATWASQPLISVTLNEGPGADESLRSVVGNAIPIGSCVFRRSLSITCQPDSGVASSIIRQENTGWFFMRETVCPHMRFTFTLKHSLKHSKTMTILLTWCMPTRTISTAMAIGRTHCSSRDGRLSC